MATVQNLAFISKERLKDLISFVNFEYNNSGFPPFPLDIIHYLLPLRLKFLKESYVAADDNKVYGLISLEKDDSNPKRLKISQLFLRENSIEYAELLINYVVNKFLAKGAESFFVVVDEADDKMLKLLSDVCKFRILADEYLFKIKKSDFPYEKEHGYNFIKFSKNYETAKIADLYNGLINSHQQPAFQINEKFFNDSIFVGIKNKISFKYVLVNPENKSLFGYFVISTRNGSDFILDVVLAPSYEVYLADILKFVKSEISKRNPSWTLYIKIKSYFINHKILLDVMKNYDFEPFKKSKILVKDLYKEIKTDNPLYNKQIVFNAPAY